MSAKQFLPREHGTWAMLLVPFVVGCGVARQFALKELYLAAATLTFFLAQNQLMIWVRLRFASPPDLAAMSRVRNLFLIFVMIGSLAVTPLLWFFHLHALLFFGAASVLLVGISVKLVTVRKDRSLGGQILASAGLSLSAPLAHYAALGRLEHAAFDLWALNFLFFLGGVFYVQLKIGALSRKNKFVLLLDQFRFAGRTLACDVAILVLAFFILRRGSLSLLTLIAFLPTMAQAIVGTLRLDHPAKLKRVGVLATVYSILFAAIVIWLA